MDSIPSAVNSRSGLTLSVVIPAYNEMATIAEILKRVQDVPIEKEIIVVDDGSTDGTREFLEKIAPSATANSQAKNSSPEGHASYCNELRFIFQEKNRGKGAALRRGFEKARGEIVVIQDADLELNPQEYPRLIEPIQRGVADVVYGSRFLGKNREGVPVSRYLANKGLTLASNLCTGLCLTDVWTGYKTFRRDVLQRIQLREDRFAFEAEITAKIARYGYRVHEVPVSYSCRSYAEGKKINWQDSVRGIWSTFRYSAFR
jgi:glycosyltransferase involved in cell wall biosynthesis